MKAQLFYNKAIPRIIRYCVHWPSDTTKDKIKEFIKFLESDGVKFRFNGIITVELNGYDPAGHAIFIHKVNKFGFICQPTLP